MSEAIQAVRLNQVQDFRFDIDASGALPPLRAAVPVAVQVTVQVLDGTGACFK